MKLQYKKIHILSFITLILVLMLIICQHQICYTTNLFNSSLSKDGDLQIAYRGENTIITVRMLNSSDPIIGELTLFYDQLNDILIGGEFTNSSGYAVLDWSIPPDYPLGQTCIRAYCPNRPDAIIDVDLLIKSKTVFENLTHPTSAHPEEYLLVGVNLMDNNNNSIPDQQVNLYDYQNTSIAESITNTFGYCNLSWEIPYDMVLGIYTFEIRFEGNELYDPVESEFNVTIIGSSLEIISINLNATVVKPNTPISVTVEITDDNPLILVKINGVMLEKADGTTWRATIIAPSDPGKYFLNVIVYYNETPCVNNSDTYFIVKGETLDLSKGAFLLFLNNDESTLGRNLTFLYPISALAIISAIVAWKKKKRHPSFSRDYTLEVGPYSS
ncbi:MAG: hypothetical protein ACUVXA_14995 [Candidatus Jordarchaeum sp.]|uniref:hypothetical protein n=1 Tax=Candidatus Jordarchaeum sp. TaxID=2823881 RepID=UPI004049BCA5